MALIFPGLDDDSQAPKIFERPISQGGGRKLLETRNGKIYYHRDYFDMGSLLYEHLPLLGKIIQKLNKEWPDRS